MNSSSKPSERLPLVGEATRGAARPAVATAPGTRPAAPEATPTTSESSAPAPVIALHGVGDFAAGDVIGEIAKQTAFSGHESFHRETVFARNYRFTALMRRDADAVNARATRLFEVNWSEVRRPTPNMLGIARNFVSVLFALNRIAVYGASRPGGSATPLLTGVLTLWLIEALAVWSALVPAVSALLWQIDPGQRFAAGLLVGGAAAIAAGLLRHVSRPMAVGGLLFALLCALAGWWSCSQTYGDFDVAGYAALVHVGATLLAVFAVLMSALEMLLRRGRGERRPKLVHRLSRMGCLWLPMVMLMLLQPLTVAALLVPMSNDVRSDWGYAFSAMLPFEPEDVQRAVGWIALLLTGSILLGALLFKMVQRFGRNATVFIGWGVGGGVLIAAWVVDATAFDGCDLCRRCLRYEWVGGAALMLALGASVTWLLFARSEVPIDATGRAWYPAGAFARFWASVMLAAMPLVLIAAASWLVLRIPEHAGAPIVSDAAAIFMQSTKYALLLAPLLTKPFAAFLDALGDVFFFVVKQRNLNTRLNTMPRLWKALQLLAGGNDACAHVVVLAHSQGTAIAAAMFSRMARVLARSRVRLTLVTVGSPVTTLYRNFLNVSLGEEYAALCRMKPEQFRWFNLCRPADYIGGEIELDGVVNRDLLTAGDHVGYWRDAQLLAWLAAVTRGEG